jgi:hypothetical protein
MDNVFPSINVLKIKGQRRDEVYQDPCKEINAKEIKKFSSGAGLSLEVCRVSWSVARSEK